jgi:hypothetical protein
MGQKPITGSNPVISAITHVKASRTGYLKLRTGSPFALLAAASMAEASEKSPGFM